MNSLMPVQQEAWTPADAWPSSAPPPVYPSSKSSAPVGAAPRQSAALLAPVPTPIRAAPAPRQPGAVAGNGRAIRALDILGASAMIVMLAPVMLLTALAIMILDPGPLLFGHTRVGKGGRPFQCLKFRSMMVDADARLAHLLETDPLARAEWLETQKLRRDPRITPIGRFLRRSCLDELPQLFNVLRGDMSLVGPRPIVAGEAARYGRHFPVYCSLKPGITGLWQVKRQDQTTYRRRVAFDLAYARSRSLALNLRILLLTVPCVLRGEGAC
jgi:exopolysaccharide production protein ExoY